MFYAPWCDHCRALKPRFAKVAAMAKEHSLMPLGAVDCTHNGHLCIDVDVVSVVRDAWREPGANISHSHRFSPLLPDACALFLRSLAIRQ